MMLMMVVVVMSAKRGVSDFCESGPTGTVGRVGRVERVERVERVGSVGCSIADCRLRFCAGPKRTCNYSQTLTDTQHLSLWEKFTFYSKPRMYKFDASIVITLCT